MKYWSNGPSSLLWTDWHLGCSWSVLGEVAALKVQTGITYTDLDDWWVLEPRFLLAQRVQIPDLGAHLLFFLQVAAEMNPVGWCKFPLLGPLVSCEMLRTENQDLFVWVVLNSNYEVFEQKCYIQLSKYLAFHCWGRGGFDHYLVTCTILFFCQYSHLVFLFVLCCAILWHKCKIKNNFMFKTKQQLC